MTKSSSPFFGAGRRQRKRKPLFIDCDGHCEILLSSIPKLSNVKGTAYAKGQTSEEVAWVKQQPAVSVETRIYENDHETLEKEQSVGKHKRPATSTAPTNSFGIFISELRGEGQPMVSSAEIFNITHTCLKARDAADARV